ncbi:calcium-binding protein, partial [Devosia sp.]|uniref:calcium-binding protein n=1 Tax=Devosia sp. TaxID=1871048 RepID=UPI0035B19535
DTIASTDPTHGGIDDIEAGLGADIVVGGAAGDQLKAGGDTDTSRDIILGDDGELVFFTTGDDTGYLKSAKSINPAYGGGDTITTGNGDNIVIAGSGADDVDAGSDDDIILGDNGEIIFSAADIVERISSTDPDYGGIDDIEAGDGADIVVGGVAGDLISAGGETDVDEDIVLGDEGELLFFATGELQHAYSIVPDKGGADTITTGGGDNVVIGGADGDSITASGGADIILGDNGRLEFDLGGPEDSRRLILARSTDPLLGGGDTIEAGDGNDLVFGGTAADTIRGSGGHDMLFGDHGLYDIDLPLDSRGVSIFFRSGDEGGNDTIHGGDGDDMVFGQQGDDTIYGDGGDDDIVGGHNVVGGADGSDTIDGGDFHDVILGDNGMIFRTRTVDDWKTVDWERGYWGAGRVYGAIIRDVLRFDLSDYVGGNDILGGGRGDDLIYGQRGNDTIDGGGGLDDLVGGMGSDTIRGGGGNDILIGDEATIYKAFDGNGSARLNTDLSWHRDIVLEEVGVITDRPAINTNQHAVDSTYAAALLNSDMVLLAGGYTDAGKQLSGNGAWATSALLVELESGWNDTLQGEDQDDLLIGQRGSDSLAGGNGNDTLFGDRATNLSSVSTDLPLIINAVRLIGASSAAGVFIPIGGQVVTPMVDLMPSALNPNAPQLNLIPDAAGRLADMARNDRLIELAGSGFGASTLEVFASLVPDLVHSEDTLPRGDALSGGDGNDTIFGDDGLIFSPIETGFATIDNEINGVSASLLSLLADFDALSFGQAAIESIGRTTTLGYGAGNDAIDAGAGDDTVFGDFGRIIMPSTHGLSASGASLQAAALSFHAMLQDLQHVTADMAFVVHETSHGLINEYASRTGFTSPSNYVAGGNATTWKMRPSTYQLLLGNDTIAAGDGNDMVVGDSGFVVAQAMAANGTIAGSKVTSAAHTTIENALKAQDNTLDTALRNHLNARHPDDTTKHTSQSDKKAQWLFENGHPFQLSVGNDTIMGGIGNDTLVGDFATIHTGVLFSPTNDSREVTDLSKAADTALGTLATRLFVSGNGYRPLNAEAIITGAGLITQVKTSDWSYDGGYNYWWLETKLSDKRHSQKMASSALTLYSDRIEGGDGNDILVGDAATLKPLIAQGNTTGLYNTFTVVPVAESGFTSAATDAYMYKFGPFARLLAPNDENTAHGHNYIVSDDTIYGGIGDDMAFGQIGNDTMYGEAGNDRLSTGDGRDWVSGGAGTNQVAITSGRDTQATSGGGKDNKVTTIDVGGTAKPLVRTTWGTPMVSALATDIIESKSLLQPSGAMFVGFRDYNTAAPPSSTDKFQLIKAVSMVVPTTTSLISAVRSSEIVVKLVDEDRNANTAFQQLWVYDEVNQVFVAQNATESETVPLLTETPVRKRLPSVLYDVEGQKWITVDYEEGYGD